MTEQEALAILGNTFTFIRFDGPSEKNIAVTVNAGSINGAVPPKLYWTFPKVKRLKEMILAKRPMREICDTLEVQHDAVYKKVRLLKNLGELPDTRYCAPHTDSPPRPSVQPRIAWTDEIDAKAIGMLRDGVSTKKTAVALGVSDNAIRYRFIAKHREDILRYSRTRKKLAKTENTD
jgi:hypothetical protein